MKSFSKLLFIMLTLFLFSSQYFAQVSWKSDEAKLKKAELINSNVQRLDKKSNSITTVKDAGPVEYYFDESEFIANSADLSVEDFNNSAVPTHSMGSFNGVLNSSTNNAVFKKGSIVSGIEFRSVIEDELILLGSDSYFPTDINLLATNYWCDNLEITFTSPVSSFAFIGFETYDGGLGKSNGEANVNKKRSSGWIELYDNDGKLIDGAPIYSDYWGEFIGLFSADVKIKRAVISADCNGLAIGHVMFGGGTKNPPPFLANMEDNWLNYGNKTDVKLITGTTTATGPATCTSAVVRITENYSKGKDVLMLNPGTGLRSSFNVNTGTLTVTGYAPTAVYQNVIRNIIYLYFSSQTIPISTQERRVDFTLYSDKLVSNTVYRYIYFGGYEKLNSETENTSNEQIPTDFNLYQNYPNPFNPVTSIRFAIPAEGFTSLNVYNMLGQEVASLMNEDLIAGVYEVKFDGSKLSSGTYFYRLSSGNNVETKKFILMK
jgi:hypothetical protein